MNQWLAWCWNTYLSPPMTGEAWEFLHGRAAFTRGHFAYGLLVGRVFIGCIVSRWTVVSVGGS